MSTPVTDSKQWFSETEAMWPGQKFSLEIDHVLFQGKSDFQDVLVFQSATYGNVLVLDGVIQLTERDEFAYQEMITHLPLFAHKQPKRVLIVGGGDGGVLREVTKHDCVQKIVMCEIDPMVCHVSKKFFKNTVATAFDDPRVTLLHADAAVYLKEHTSDKFDVVIVDSSDPVGPAEVLYRAEFYESMKKCLSPDGVICTQGECLWLHLDLIADVMQRCRALFPSVNYSYTTIPTYPSGQIGFIICSLDESEGVLVKPKRTPDDKMEQTLRYYNAKIHEASFVLPSFAERKIATVRK
uniref:PABS domain-containing protein n=1 Tax=Hyaloperonospora arabidopsidis (strain Emoy2) TaxID=559515 RepID=M4C138_HYAAE